MKKIICLLLILASTFAILPNTYALEYYNKVYIKTAFAEDVDIDKINKIELAVADATDLTKYIELNKESNFEYTIDGVPVGNIVVEYAVVENDYLGKYSIDDIQEVEGEDVYILVTISLTNNPTSELKLTDAAKKLLEPRVVSLKEPEKQEESVKQEGIEVEEDEEIVIGDTPTQTTTVPTTIHLTDDEKYQLEQYELEQQKEKNKKKNNLVGIILFSIIGIVILVLGSFALIKIANANKD